MPASSDFQKAAAAVKKFTKEPPDEIKLQLYAYFKQGSQDPPFAEAVAPGTFEFKAKYKYNAWKKVNDDGVKPAEAQKKYIELYKKLKSDYE